MTKTRKHLTRFRLLGLVSALPILGLTAQAQSTLTNGLVAYWNFDSANFKDSIGKFDGTPNGTDPIQFVSGKSGFGQAIQLNGVDQFVEITGRDATYDPDALGFAGGAVSISAWFTVGSFDKSWQALVAKGEGSDWRVARDGSTSFMSYAGGLTDATGQTDVTDGKWHHIVAVSDPTGANFGTAIYVDGNLDGTITGDAALVTNGKNVKIGDNPDATGRYWNGLVDDVAIWNRVLTSAEISAIYAGGSGKPIAAFLGAQNPFVIGTPTGSTEGFTINVVDGSTQVADTNTIALKYDGAAVTPSSVSGANGITTIAYNVPNPPLASGSAHTVSLTIKDKSGTAHSADATFTAPVYPTIPAALAVTGVDTSKTGFKVRPYQVSSGQPNTIAWTEEMFAGLHGTNIADLGQVISGQPIGADGFYTYTDVINWDKDGSSDGNFTANNGYQDIVMPGQPSADGNATYNNDGEEVLTYVQFPKGGQFYTMGVNSDDGFKVSTGANPRDVLSSITLGIFDGGRGASDTIFKFWVPQAGTYPMRLLWENGGSGANCEWFLVQPDKTKILLNDPASTNTSGVKAFYSGPGFPAYAQTLSQTPSQLTIRLIDAGTQVDASSVKLSVNGQSVTATSTKSGNTTTVTYSPATPFASGSTNTLTLVYKDSAGAVTDNASFVTTSYATIDGSWAVTGVDTTKRGFKVKPYQVASGQPNSMKWTEEMFAGKHGDNIADLTQVIDGSKIDASGYYTVTNVVNWDKDGSADGNFTADTGFPDSVMPGQPSADGNATYNNDGEEVLTFLQFPNAGFYTMGVNSDDGFRVTAGVNPALYPPGVICGQFDAGRGSSDTTFPIYVAQPGLYRFRLLWENGGSGANCEWFTVQPDGTKILVNDSSNANAIKAYYSGPAAPTNVVASASFTAVSVSANHTSAVLTYTGTLQSGDAVNGPWTDVTGATSPATITISSTGKKFYRVH